MTTLMTQNPAMRGEKIYEYEFDITGITDYGVSMGDILANREPIPLQGARFDLAVTGRGKGPLSGRAHGVDYLRVRADGRIELDLHVTIETEDGRRIALSGDGQAAPEVTNQCSISLPTSVSPPRPKNMHGSMRGRVGQ